MPLESRGQDEYDSSSSYCQGRARSGSHLVPSIDNTDEDIVCGKLVHLHFTYLEII